MIEADLRGAAGEFERDEDAAVRLRTQVLVERLGGHPLLDQDDRFLRRVLFVDVAGGAPLLSPYRSLDGAQQLPAPGHVGSAAAES